jgi:hypothetical protein
MDRLVGWSARTSSSLASGVLGGRDAVLEMLASLLLARASSSSS